MYRAKPKSDAGFIQKAQDAAPAVGAETPAYLLKVVAIIVVAVIAQTTVAPYLTVLGAKPDVALVAVVCLALMLGPVWGAAAGFSAGLLLDIALVQIMGISSFLFTLAGYFSGRLAERVDPASWLPPVVAVFTATLVVESLSAVIMFLLGVEASVWFIGLRIVLPEAILNALLTSPIFAVCRWWLGGNYKQNVFVSKQ